MTEEQLEIGKKLQGNIRLYKNNKINMSEFRNKSKDWDKRLTMLAHSLYNIKDEHLIEMDSFLEEIATTVNNFMDAKIEKYKEELKDL